MLRTVAVLALAVAALGCAPPDKCYQCTDNNCVVADSGIALDACQTVCRAPTPPPPAPTPEPVVRYTCDKTAYKCINGSIGHSTVDRCLAACGPPTPAPPTNVYTCNQTDATCSVDPAGPNENTTTKLVCQVECGLTVKYACDALAGTCAKDASGSMSLPTCALQCQTQYACNSTLGKCVPDADGSDMSTCAQFCTPLPTPPPTPTPPTPAPTPSPTPVPTPPPDKYVCADHKCAKDETDGGDLAVCQQLCK